MIQQLQQLNPAVAITLIIGCTAFACVFIWQLQKSWRKMID